MMIGKALLASAKWIPPIGSFVGGGFCAGIMKSGNDRLLVIVAPRALGESPGLYLKNSNTTTPNTVSLSGGSSNTYWMIQAGQADHPAASFCTGLAINGYTDWVLPAKDQLELCYRNLKPTTSANTTDSGANTNSDPAGANYTAGLPAQTTVDAFKVGGTEAFATDNSYWSSTESGLTSSFLQMFTDGSQLVGTKANNRRVRAIRTVKL